MYGHIAKLAETEKKGIEAAGGKADLYQVKETLPAEVLQKMYAPGQSDQIPFITPDKLQEYDAFLFGMLVSALFPFDFLEKAFHVRLVKIEWLIPMI